MPLSPKLGAEAIAANMAELHPPLTDQQALAEANRCLYCFDAPCIKACPTGIDVPSFIRKIASGNLTGSARTIFSANILGSSCARVCPTSVLCEGACVLLDRDAGPIQIGLLQRFATDHFLAHPRSLLRTAEAASGRRVAVIGGGPAGLGCAAELAQLGHKVVVFEKRPQAGGLNTYGIAYYKMKPEVSLAEVELVRSLGVDIRYNTEVGRDLSTEDLFRDFDAIFLGLGLGGGARLGIPGEDLPGVVDAVDFISRIHTQPLHEVPIGERVVVIGCGNTSIDAVTQARRLGARSVIGIYRREESDMPAYDFEYQLAKKDGVQFLFKTAALEVLPGEDGQVKALRLANTTVSPEGRVEVVPGTEFIRPVDMLIRAVGQEKLVGPIRRLFPELELDDHGRVRYDFATGQTNLPKVFAGGDCANGGREVVNAVAEGKRAARGIHAALSGQKVAGPVQPSRLGVAGLPVGSGFDQPVRVPERQSARKGKTEKHG